MRKLLSVDQRYEMFVFSQTAKHFYKILEKKLYLHGGNGNTGGPQGLPYTAMQAFVNQTYKTCGAIAANQLTTCWPSSQQRNAMNRSISWGKGPEGFYSLELKFAPTFEDDPFINCFNNTISKWVDNYYKSYSSILLTCTSIILVLSITVGLYIYHKRQKKKNSNTHTNLFRNTDSKKKNSSNSDGEKTPLTRQLQTTFLTSSFNAPPHQTCPSPSSRTCDPR